MSDLSGEVASYGSACAIVAMDGLRLTERNIERLPSTMPIIEAVINAAAQADAAAAAVRSAKEAEAAEAAALGGDARGV